MVIDPNIGFGNLLPAEVRLQRAAEQAPELTPHVRLGPCLEARRAHHEVVAPGDLEPDLPPQSGLAVPGMTGGDGQRPRRQPDPAFPLGEAWIP